MRDPAIINSKLNSDLNLDGLSVSSAMAIYRAGYKTPSRKLGSIAEYDPIENRRQAEALRQGHHFLTLPEKHIGFRGVIVSTVIKNPSKDISAYERTSLSKEFAKILNKHRAEGSDGVVIRFNEEELSPPLLSELRDLQEKGIFITVANPNGKLKHNVNTPIDGIAVTIENAADLLKVKRVADHPEGIRSLLLLERPSILPGTQYLEVQPWFPQDTNNDQLIYNMKEELHLLLPYITTSSVVIVLNGRVIGSELVEMLTDQFDRHSIASSIFAPFASTSCEEDPKLRIKVHHTRSEASAALYRDLLVPRLKAPPGGFTSIKPPHWERSNEGFFVIQPNRDIDLSSPDSEGAKRFINELPYMAGEANNKIFMVMHDLSVDHDVVRKIYSELHTRLERSAGLLVILSSRSDFAKKLGLGQELVIRSNIDSAYDALASHYSIEPPYNRWVYFRRPERLSEERTIIRLSFKNYFEKLSIDKNIWNSVKSEYQAVLRGDSNKILLALGNEVISDGFAGRIREFGEEAIKNGKQLEVVSNDYNSRVNLKYASRGVFFNVHKNREEAILACVYGLENPNTGWETFKIEKPFPNKNLKILRVHFSEESIKSYRVGNGPLGDIYSELSALQRSGYSVILDIPRGVSTIIDENTLGALAWSYGEYYNKPSKLVLVCDNNHVTRLLNFDRKNIFDSFAEAYRNVSEKYNE